MRWGRERRSEMGICRTRGRGNIAGTVIGKRHKRRRT
jgi:hypothetical protein